MYIAVVIAVLLLIVLGISLYLARFPLYPKTKDYKFTYQNEIDRGNFTEAYYNSLNREEIKIKSSFGYDINAIYFPCENSKITVVIAHGYSYSLFGSIKYIKMFHNLGISALAYDQRYHGLSGGKNSTFGYLEKYDLSSVIDYVKERFPSDMSIGTHGESLGGATVLMHGAMDGRVDFIISDCAFCSMKEEITHRLKLDKNLPAFPFVNIASFINRIIAGFYYGQVSPANAAASIKAPTMIIHGTADTCTPYTQGEKIYKNLSSSKYFYGAVGAEHAKSIVVDEDQYTEEVRIFLSQNNLI